MSLLWFLAFIAKSGLFFAVIINYLFWIIFTIITFQQLPIQSMHVPNCHWKFGISLNCFQWCSQDMNALYSSNVKNYLQWSQIVKDFSKGTGLHGRLVISMELDCNLIIQNFLCRTRKTQWSCCDYGVLCRPQVVTLNCTRVGDSLHQTYSKVQDLGLMFEMNDYHQAWNTVNNRLLLTNEARTWSLPRPANEMQQNA